MRSLLDAPTYGVREGDKSAVVVMAPDEDLVTVVFRRAVTLVEWREIIEGIFSASSFRRGPSILLDRRVAPVPDTKDMRWIARYIDAQEASERTRGWAFLVGEVTSYGMGRMAQLLSEHENSIAVFEKHDEALNWLSLRRETPLKRRRIPGS